MSANFEHEFPYVEFSIDSSSALRSRKMYRPIVPVTLLHKKKFVQYAALLDTGADYCIFHGDIAAYLGIYPLSSGKKRKIMGINGGTIKGYEHVITIKIASRQISSPIIFSNQIPNNAQAVLGTIGFFDKFRVTFDFGNKRIRVVR